ncbi:MliC family protein [Streptobacillus canis]|uniref:MliC family protein n=1 Tax=Streptobacillus canis TaxID=2678686 RepID=UPI0012E2CA28|nr:MliC family protein [Streptobacillus canis]
MKKLMVIPMLLLAMNAYSNSNTIMNTNKMVKNEKDLMEKLDEEIILNLHSTHGKHSHAKLRIKGDEALVNVDGKEYKLNRKVSASGEKFSDGNVNLAMKGNEAYIEIKNVLKNYEIEQESLDEVKFVMTNVEGNKKTTIKGTIKGDEALVNVDGKEYKLNRKVSASGEMFTDGMATLGIKGDMIFFELNDKHEESFDEIILNLHNIKGEAHSHVLAVIKGDDLFLKVDGKEYNLKRTMSASGEMFSNGKVTFGIKGKEAYVEMNGKVASYVVTGQASKGYAKDMKHDHK